LQNFNHCKGKKKKFQPKYEEKVFLKNPKPYTAIR